MNNYLTREIIKVVQLKLQSNKKERFCEKTISHPEVRRLQADE